MDRKGKPQMDEEECKKKYERLKEDVESMFLIDDLRELEDIRGLAFLGLEEIYYFHLNRVLEKL